MNNEGVTRVMFLLLLFIALCNGWNLPQYPGDSNVPKYPNQIGQNNDQQFSTEPDNLPTPEDFIQAGLPDPSPNEPYSYSPGGIYDVANSGIQEANNNNQLSPTGPDYPTWEEVNPNTPEPNYGQYSHSTTPFSPPMNNNSPNNRDLYYQRQREFYDQEIRRQQIDTAARGISNIARRTRKGLMSIGYLEVRGVDHNCKVYVDDVESRKSCSLNVGEHKVKVTKFGFEPYEEWVIIRPMKTSIITPKTTRMAKFEVVNFSVSEDIYNPDYNKSAKFLCTVTAPGSGIVNVVDEDGNQIFTSDVNFEKEENIIKWKGKNKDGNKVKNGLYSVILTVPDPKGDITVKTDLTVDYTFRRNIVRAGSHGSGWGNLGSMSRCMPNHSVCWSVTAGAYGNSIASPTCEGVPLRGSFTWVPVDWFEFQVPVSGKIVKEEFFSLGLNFKFTRMFSKSFFGGLLGEYRYRCKNIASDHKNSFNLGTGFSFKRLFWDFGFNTLYEFTFKDGTSFNFDKGSVSKLKLEPYISLKFLRHRLTFSQLFDFKGNFSDLKPKKCKSELCWTWLLSETCLNVSIIASYSGQWVYGIKLGLDIPFFNVDNEEVLYGILEVVEALADAASESNGGGSRRYGRHRR